MVVVGRAEEKTSDLLLQGVWNTTILGNSTVHSMLIESTAIKISKLLNS